jgi:hypothetical protein
MATLTLDTRQRSLLDKLAEERDERAPDTAERPASARAATGATPAATLDAIVARSWSSLRVTRAASCLLCGGEVAARYGSGPHPVGGTCRSCGTSIS